MSKIFSDKYHVSLLMYKKVEWTQCLVAENTIAIFNMTIFLQFLIMFLVYSDRYIWHVSSCILWSTNMRYSIPWNPKLRVFLFRLILVITVLWNMRKLPSHRVNYRLLRSKLPCSKRDNYRLQRDYQIYDLPEKYESYSHKTMNLRCISCIFRAYGHKHYKNNNITPRNWPI